jgi:hypothetical protein
MRVTVNDGGACEAAAASGPRLGHHTNLAGLEQRIVVGPRLVNVAPSDLGRGCFEVDLDLRHGLLEGLFRVLTMKQKERGGAREAKLKPRLDGPG